MPAALATGNSQAFADLAAAISANKFAAIDATVAGESPLLSSLEHWPFTAEGTLRNVAIDQYTLNIDNVLDAIDAWDAEHPVVTNPPAVTQPPLDLGLPATAPEWLTLFQEAFGELPEVEPSGGNGNNSNNGGSNGNSGSSSGAHALPAWLAQLQNLVARGVQHLNNAPSTSSNGSSSPNEPTPLRTIEATQWTSLFHGESQVFLGARAGVTDDVVRVVDGHVYAMDYEVIHAQMSDADVAAGLIADWDQWFLSAGEEVDLTADSLAALHSRITADFDPIRNQPNDPLTERLRLSLASQEGRIESLQDGTPEELSEIDRLHYSELVAYTRGSLKNPDDAESDANADAFIQAYGFAGMWRLYQMEVIGHWEVAIEDLTIVGDPLYPAFPGPAFQAPLFGTILVNNRDLNEAGLPIPQASAAEIAQRVHSAIHQPGVTIGGSGVSSPESTAAAAWSAFWEHPRTQGLMGMGFATLQMVGGVVLAKGSGGTLTTIGATSFLRGVDQFQASFQQAFLGQDKVRDFTHQIVDNFASRETSDTIVSVGDFVLGVADLTGGIRKGAQKAVQESTERIGRVSNTSSTISPEALDASNQLLANVNSASTRLANPFSAVDEASEGLELSRAISRNHARTALGYSDNGDAFAVTTGFAELSGGGKRLVNQLRQEFRAAIGSGIRAEDLADASRFLDAKLAVVQNVHTKKLFVIRGDRGVVPAQRLSRGDLFVIHTHPTFTSVESHFALDIANTRRTTQATAEAVIDWSHRVTYYNQNGILPEANGIINEHGYIVGYGLFR